MSRHILFVLICLYDSLTSCPHKIFVLHKKEATSVVRCKPVPLYRLLRQRIIHLAEWWGGVGGGGGLDPSLPCAPLHVHHHFPALLLLPRLLVFFEQRLPCRQADVGEVGEWVREEGREKKGERAKGKCTNVDKWSVKSKRQRDGDQGAGVRKKPGQGFHNSALALKGRDAALGKQIQELLIIFPSPW